MENVAEILVTDIQEKYRELRLCNPSAERKMEASLRRYGQISPVVVWESMEEHFEIIDGFKRLHATKRIGAKLTLTARILKSSIHSAKAAILYLNWSTRTVTDMEEAFVVRSLIREDGMQQVDVADLLERDKSWVSRRCSLAERLCEQVIDEIHLGLISSTTGRELAKLPRGNQAKVLEAVVRERLSTREVTKLVGKLKETDYRQWEPILAHPREMEEADLPLTRDARLSLAGNRLKRDAILLINGGCRLRREISTACLSQYSDAELAILSPFLGKVEREASLVIQAIEATRKYTELIKEDV